jgi:hypothetical protein
MEKSGGQPHFLSSSHRHIVVVSMPSIQPSLHTAILVIHIVLSLLLLLLHSQSLFHAPVVESS